MSMLYTYESNTDYKMLSFSKSNKNCIGTKNNFV